VLVQSLEEAESCFGRGLVPLDNDFGRALPREISVVGLVAVEVEPAKTIMPPGAALVGECLQVFFSQLSGEEVEKEGLFRTISG